MTVSKEVPVSATSTCSSIRIVSTAKDRNRIASRWCHRVVHIHTLLTIFSICGQNLAEWDDCLCRNHAYSFIQLVTFVASDAFTLLFIKILALRINHCAASVGQIVSSLTLHALRVIEDRAVRILSLEVVVVWDNTVSLEQRVTRIATQTRAIGVVSCFAKLINLFTNRCRNIKSRVALQTASFISKSETIRICISITKSTSLILYDVSTIAGKTVSTCIVEGFA